MTNGPFGHAAQLYRKAGWLGTIPLGREPGKKGPPLSGFTGHDGRYPDGGDIGTWLSSGLAAHNIGLRMPAGVIGLDIDACYTKVENGKEVVKRGEVTLARLEAEWGPLPPTWVSSARPAPSGIRFFRVPLELDGRPINWPGEAGKDIEIVQPGHRYAVVWPSTNPDAGGAPYKWMWSEGGRLDSLMAGPPEIADLSPLPDAWVRGLALSYDRADKADVGDVTLSAWWGRARTGAPCAVITSVTQKTIATLRAVDGSRHEAARDGLRAIVAAGGDGHRGAPEAVGQLAAAFEAAVGEARMQSGEWIRLLRGALQLAVAAHPDGPRQQCAHDIPPATGGVLPADFTQLALQKMSSASPVHGSTPPTGFGISPGDLPAVITQLNGIPEHDERKARAREYVRSVAGHLTTAQAQEWREQLKLLVGLTFGDFDAIMAEARRQRRNESVSRAATEAAGGEKVVLPQPDAPLRVARELVAREPNTHRRFWRDDFYLWTGTCYQVTPAADVRTWVYRQTEHAVYLADGKDGPEERFWHPTAHKVSQVIDALAHGALARPTADDQQECIALTNGVLDPATRTLLPHTPERFNLTSLPFAYSPDATCPRWLAFLAEVLDQDSVRFLRQWFGYLISGRTDQHKIASLVGASRSGKGTIGRVATAIMGQANVTAPNLPSLTETFGLEPLLGKSLAIFGDVKWSAHGVADATERLKTISGDDGTSVHRKNRTAWEGRLPTRFMLLSNNTPTFTDSSGALANRMIHVHFTKSFAGRENPNLTNELLAELPGILLWALGGLDDLQLQGRFTVPAASEAIDAEVRLASAPHAVFVADRCMLGPEARIPLDILWSAWLSWCTAEGTTPGDKRWFARNLKDALPELSTERVTTAGEKVRYVVGLALAHPPGLPPAFPPGVTAGSSGP